MRILAQGRIARYRGGRSRFGLESWLSHLLVQGWGVLGVGGFEMCLHGLVRGICVSLPHPG